MSTQQKNLNEAFNIIYDAVNLPNSNENADLKIVISKLDQVLELQKEVVNPDRMLKMKEVEKMCGFEKTTIYKMIKKGSFPPPKKYGRSSLWKLSEVQEWVAMQ